MKSKIALGTLITGAGLVAYGITKIICETKEKAIEEIIKTKSAEVFKENTEKDTKVYDKVVNANKDIRDEVKKAMMGYEEEYRDKKDNTRDKEFDEMNEKLDELLSDTEEKKPTYQEILEKDSKEVMNYIKNDFIVSVEKYEFTPCYDSKWLIECKNKESGETNKIDITRLYTQDNKELAELLNKCRSEKDIKELNTKVGWYMIKK